jgi:hypothetical protein
LAATGAEGPLTFVVTAGPTQGALSGTAPHIHYTPRANYNGADSFSFRVSDGISTSNGTISLQVRAINDAPVITSQSFTTPEDTPRELTVAASDVDGDSLQFTAAYASWGTLSGTGPNFTYTPRANWNGVDQLNFRVSDGQLSSPLVASTITVTPVGDPPVAINPVHQGVEDVNWNFGLLVYASDPDGDVLTPTLTRAPANGTVTLYPPRNGVQATVTYAPNPNWTGDDSFELSISDGTSSVPMTATVHYAPANDAPVATPQTVFVDEDTPKEFTLAGTDGDGDALTFTVVNGPAYGTLSGTAPNLTYTPPTNFNGVQEMTFRVSDGTGAKRDRNGHVACSTDR